MIYLQEYPLAGVFRMDTPAVLHCMRRLIAYPTNFLLTDVPAFLVCLFRLAESISWYVPPIVNLRPQQVQQIKKSAALRTILCDG